MIIDPKISFSFNGQENDIVGDYFKGADELTWGNIFFEKKLLVSLKVKKVSISKV